MPAALVTSQVLTRSSPRKPWLVRVFWLWRERGLRYLARRLIIRLRGTRRYSPNWIRVYDKLSSNDFIRISSRIAQLPHQPLISVVLQINKISMADARATIDSVIAQLYGRWELLIITTEDDISSTDYGASDPRIILIPVSGILPRALAANTALSSARGEFIAFLDHRDRLASTAFYLIVEALNERPGIALIYSDEDSVDGSGLRSRPNFKSEWNPDLFLSQNYFGSFTVYRSRAVREIGGFHDDFVGGEDYDLGLRMVGRIPSDAILHLPFLLNHRLITDVDGRADLIAAGQRALSAHLDRCSIVAKVELSHSGLYYRVKRLPPANMPPVSLIMPTRDRLSLLRGAVESILSLTDYPNYEIVIVDNQSVESETLAYFSSLKSEPRVRVLQYDAEFNYSAINNFAVRHCTSPILGLINNDILIINRDWLNELVSHVVRPEVGAVGAMLYYPNDTIQHAGTIVGFGGAAINCYVGLPRGASGDFGRAELIQNYSAVTAACLLTRAEVFNEVGGLNETDLSIAFNDVDFCLKVRARGYLVTWTPYAELYHLESASRGDDLAPGKMRRAQSERRYLADRWPGMMMNDPHYNPNLSLYEGPFRLAEAPRQKRPWLS